MNITWHNEKRRIRELIPYVANPRQITDKQAKDLKASLERFGVADPIIINTDNTIIGGHQRKKILETLMGVDPDYEIDVRVPDRELSIDEMRELNVRLNKNTGSFDFDILANNFELDDLLEWGFERTELDLDLWADDPLEDAEPQIDRAEELREIWGVETGQLWQLGSHRLICGDCTDKAVVERVMRGERAQLFFTDPPYGMDKGFANDELKGNDLTAFNDRWVSQYIGEDDAMFISFHSPRLFWTILDSARNNGWRVGRYFSLYKPNDMTFPWHSWLGVSESILLFMRGTPKFNSEKPSDTSFWHDTYIWNHKGLVSGETKSDRQTLSHPSIKPIPVCEDLIWKTSFPESIVYDPFLGSGTTLIACERLNRKCRAVEISPAYVAVSIQRWVDVTGGVPELVED